MDDKLAFNPEVSKTNFSDQSDPHLSFENQTKLDDPWLSDSEADLDMQSASLLESAAGNYDGVDEITERLRDSVCLNDLSIQKDDGRPKAKLESKSKAVIQITTCEAIEVKKSKTRLVDVMPEARTLPTRKLQIIDPQPMKMPTRIPNQEKLKHSEQSSMKLEKQTLQNVDESEKNMVLNKNATDLACESTDVRNPDYSGNYVPFMKVKALFIEWMTVESVHYILEEDTFQNRVAFGKIVPSSSETTALKTRQAYIELCRRLDLEEKEENKCNEQILGGTQTKPACLLPDYEQLREDTKSTGHNAQAFLEGKMGRMETDFIASDLEAKSSNEEKPLKRRSKSRNSKTPEKIQANPIIIEDKDSKTPEWHEVGVVQKSHNALQVLITCKGLEFVC